MQPVPEPPDLSLNSARSADHRRGVENCGAGSDLLDGGCVLAWMTKEILHPVPVGIVPRGHRLADARRAVAEADVFVALARVTELCETAVFKGFDYGVARRVATRFCIA
jgi:hypothetical protein